MGHLKQQLLTGHVSSVFVCNPVFCFSLTEFGAILAFFQFLNWYFEVAGIRNGGDVGERVQLVRVRIWTLAVSKA